MHFKNRIRLYFVLSLIVVMAVSVKIYSTSQSFAKDVEIKKVKRIQTDDLQNKLSDKNDLLRISKEQLSLLERKIIKSIPVKDKLRSNAHHPESVLLEVSNLLGEYRELWENNAALYDDALEFYQKCVSNPKIITAIRALCMHNVQILSSRLGKEVGEINVEDLEEIKELVTDLTE